MALLILPFTEQNLSNILIFSLTSIFLDMRTMRTAFGTPKNVFAETDIGREEDHQDGKEKLISAWTARFHSLMCFLPFIVRSTGLVPVPVLPAASVMTTGGSGFWHSQKVFP